MSGGTITGNSGEGLYTVDLKRITTDAGKATESKQVWCADYTTDLTGDVAIADVPGENAMVNIRPGYSDDAAYDKDRDGVIKTIDVLTPWEFLIAACAATAVRKWRPQYRYGILTAIDYNADTCDLTVNTHYMTFWNKTGSHDINRYTTLSNVPISYMQCNSAIFEIGDEVLIEFDGKWQAPTVIGFRQEPRPCYQKEYVLIRCYVMKNQTTSGVQETRCFVWDPLLNDYATNVPLDADPGTMATFPCDPADISVWISEGNDHTKNLWNSQSISSLDSEVPYPDEDMDIVWPINILDQPIQNVDDLYLTNIAERNGIGDLEYGDGNIGFIVTYDSYRKYDAVKSRSIDPQNIGHFWENVRPVNYKSTSATSGGGVAYYRTSAEIEIHTCTSFVYPLCYENRPGAVDEISAEWTFYTPLGEIATMVQEQIHSGTNAGFIKIDTWHNHQWIKYAAFGEKAIIMLDSINFIFANNQHEPYTEVIPWTGRGACEYYEDETTQEGTADLQDPSTLTENSAFTTAWQSLYAELLTLYSGSADPSTLMIIFPTIKIYGRYEDPAA